MPDRPVYPLHGLRFRSEISLPEPPLTDDASYDVDVRRADPADVPTDAPPGTTVCDNVIDGRRWYAISARDGEFTFRFPGLCDFLLTDDLSRIEAVPDPTADEGLVSVVLAGAVASFVLTGRGRNVLHASAVAFDTATVAFVGHSGMGKSTVAAMACTLGAKLISDDTLVTKTNGSRPEVMRGTSEIRVRTKAKSIIDLFDEVPATRRTPDGRIAISPARIPDQQITLDAVVIPRPDRTAKHAVVERIAPAAAALQLARFPRLLGVQDPGLLRTQFEAAADLAASVPVLVATLPWGPPFVSAAFSEAFKRILERIEESKERA